MRGVQTVSIQMEASTVNVTLDTAEVVTYASVSLIRMAVGM